MLSRRVCVCVCVWWRQKEDNSLTGSWKVATCASCRPRNQLNFFAPFSSLVRSVFVPLSVNGYLWWFFLNELFPFLDPGPQPTRSPTPTRFHLSFLTAEIKKQNSAIRTVHSFNCFKFGSFFSPCFPALSELPGHTIRRKMWTRYSERKKMRSQINWPFM